MGQLGNGLLFGEHFQDALSVQEAEFAMKRRLGYSEQNVLITVGNLAVTYKALGRLEDALRLRRDVYSATLRLHGEEREATLIEAKNYANSLLALQRFEEVKPLLRKTVPVARRVLGDNDENTLRMRQYYALALSWDPDATLDDLREAVATLEDAERIARRVLGGAHPTVKHLEDALRNSQAALVAREARSA
tara:strand:+ start:219 stop:794 length:576 start_codon:yes stop_codon:yes gene_type:complete